MLRLLLLLPLLLLANPSLAECAPHKITGPAQVRLQGDAVMIVTHSTSTHDARFSTKRGLDEAVRFAKDNRIPIIYLQDDTPEAFYFMEDCAPDYWVFSQGGEISFDVTPSHLYIVGGHLELCMSATLHDVLYQWARRAPRNLTVTYFMDAIYSNGKLVEPDMPFYNDFQRFMGVVTYGRPGGEHWPKLSLLETMGIIVREDHEMEFLKQALPRWDTTFPASYRVELQLNDSVKKVLRPAAGWHPPTLLFHFVDSALNFTTPPPANGN
ncbi:MAG: hypothetical protein Q8J72_11585 [Rhodocyclaceae bacterium]|jgi:hypothetical protein|nr:hypothetical protein [Rhodocyclaceae bacterium]